MAQHIDNLMGEAGGAVLTAGQSFSEDTYGQAQVKVIQAIEDTVLSGVEMPNVEGSDYYNGATILAGGTVYALTLSATVVSGAIHVFLHKKNTNI